MLNNGFNSAGSKSKKVDNTSKDTSLTNTADILKKIEVSFSSDFKSELKSCYTFFCLLWPFYLLSLCNNMGLPDPSPAHRSSERFDHCWLGDRGLHPLPLTCQLASPSVTCFLFHSPFFPVAFELCMGKK